jgi:hypothetical protein
MNYLLKKLKMLFPKPLSFVLCALLLTGCGTLFPDPTTEFVASKKRPPDATASYVAIETFSEHKISGYAIYVRNTDTGEEFKMALDGRANFARGINNLVTSIKIPPGIYQISEWSVALKRSSIQNDRLSRPFLVKPGEVVFIGKFIVQTQSTEIGNYRHVFYKWKLEPISPEQAEIDFFKQYPKFQAKVIWRCHACQPHVFSNLTQGQATDI